MEDGGVMGRGYADRRARATELRFRYELRARAAVGALRERRGLLAQYRVLDLGAAEGRTLLTVRELLGASGQFDGVELSAELVAASPNLPAGVRLIEGDVTSLPPTLQCGSYDLCLALAVLEHLTDPAACVREAWRMLRPGGVFVATSPSPFWDRLATRLGLVAGEHHQRVLGRKEMLALARGAGFVRLELRPFMWAPAGILPYLRWRVDAANAYRLDRLLGRCRVPGWMFVNQRLVAEKPGERG
jgi:SAM-dependent methyltransferase